jgi:hypothetical protein
MNTTMNGIPAETERVVYAKCMNEIKRRTDAIFAILRGPHSTLYPMTNIEFVCLQIRKVLELIALASLASHKEEFAKQHQKFAEMWRAKKILEDLEKLNPNFYPVPTEQILDPKTGDVVATKQISKPYLTKEDFIAVYQKCSTMLHAENPFGPPKNLPEIETGIPIWTQKIINLLQHHQAQLLSGKHQLWVVMNGKSDGRVQVNLFERIDDPAKIAALHERTRQAAGHLFQDKEGEKQH